MDENIEVNGKIQTCMELVHINGQMDEFLQENTKMTRSMDLEFMLGLMIESTRDGGRRENKMV